MSYGQPGSLPAQVSATAPVAFRAGAMCIAAEPHRAPGEDWPCSRCLARVRTASASAVSPSSAGSAHLSAEGGTGVSDDTTARVADTRAAEGATELAQKQV